MLCKYIYLCSLIGMFVLLYVYHKHFASCFFHYFLCHIYQKHFAFNFFNMSCLPLNLPLVLKLLFQIPFLSQVSYYLFQLFMEFYISISVCCYGNISVFAQNYIVLCTFVSDANFCPRFMPLLCDCLCIFFVWFLSYTCDICFCYILFILFPSFTVFFFCSLCCLV